MSKSCQAVNNSDEGPDLCISSPPRVHKHQITPRHMKNKSSKNENSWDVHSSPTPSTPQSKLLGIKSLHSPSCSLTCSQDHREVIWDNTSPKIPRDRPRREISVTIEDFVNNLKQQSQNIPECASQASHCIKLLEKWMDKQQSSSYHEKNHEMKKKNDLRKNSCNIEALKEFVESIKNKNSNINDTASGIKLMTDKQKSFILDDDIDFDSADELWNEIDYAFLIKATQEFESYASKQNGNLEEMLTVPNTLATNYNSTLNNVSLKSNNKTDNTISKNKPILNVKQEATSNNSQNFKSQTSLRESQAKTFNSQNVSKFKSSDLITVSQLLAYNWDAKLEECEKDENQELVSQSYDWDDGFNFDDTMKSIPDEVLSGLSDISDQKQSLQNSNTLPVKQTKITNLNEVELPSKREAKSITAINKTKDSTKSSKLEATSINEFSRELFNNEDEDPFDDESILCQPEVLSWIDQVESQLSQTAKCTPEEIEKKKAEALKRRKKHLK